MMPITSLAAVGLLYMARIRTIHSAGLLESFDSPLEQHQTEFMTVEQGCFGRVTKPTICLEESGGLSSVRYLMGSSRR